METITNVVTIASKAIWGEQNPHMATGNETAGQEPVAGLQGKGTATEPYDQGNAPDPITPAGKANVTNSTSTSTTDPTISSKPHSTSNPAPSMSNPTSPEAPTNPSNAAAGGGPNPLENTEGTGVTGASSQKYAPVGGDVVPSSSSDNPGAAPASGATPSQKQQGADRPQDAPSDPSSKEDDADAILKKRDPNDHSGEPMHMHDGNEKLPATQAERRESKVGNPGGQEHGRDGPKGTGEEWVKTTGLHADGGNFDATKPGAGREADRLLEEKGIHKDAKGAMDNPESASTGSENGHKDKVSKLGKLKDKLHIGHKDK